VRAFSQNPRSLSNLLLNFFPCADKWCFQWAQLRKPCENEVFKDNPRAVFTPAQMYLYFIIPFTVLLMIFLTVLVTTRNWLSHRAHLVPTEISFSDQGIEMSSQDGVAVLSWSTYAHYKETRWNFLLWRSSAWLLIPKRALACNDDVCRLRSTLEMHLKKSSWFFG